MQALLKRAEALRSDFAQQGASPVLQIAKAGFRLREPAEADVPLEQPTQLPEILRIYREVLAYTPEELADLLALTAYEADGMDGVQSQVEDRPRSQAPPERIGIVGRSPEHLRLDPDTDSPTKSTEAKRQSLASPAIRDALIPK